MINDLELDEYLSQLSGGMTWSESLQPPATVSLPYFSALTLLVGSFDL